MHEHTWDSVLKVECYSLRTCNIPSIASSKHKYLIYHTITAINYNQVIGKVGLKEPGTRVHVL